MVGNFWAEECLGWIEVRPKEEAWLLQSVSGLREVIYNRGRQFIGLAFNTVLIVCEGPKVADIMKCLRLRYRLIIIESDAERESFPVNNSPEPVLVDVRSIVFEYENMRQGIIKLSDCREKPELKE
jgi:hypothetical protein